MKILITGGLGFIGSALVKLALEKGHKVINVDSLTYAGCIDNVINVAEHPNYIFENTDICDYNLLENIFIKYQPEAVMHLAAESHVDRSIDNPRIFVETNVNGTLNLLEATRKFWVANNSPENFRFHHISTDEVFGSLSRKNTLKFTENTPYNPRSPYSASKASSDHLVRAWFHTYGIPILITNCSNNYGPHHFPEKLIPLTILNAINEKPLPIYGNGKNIRDWLYVEDHVDALLFVLENGKVGQSYNIGSETELTNLELVQKICRILNDLLPRDNGTYEELITFVTDRPGHDYRYAINPKRIYNELGWKPITTIDQGLFKTISWYLNNENWWRPLLNNIQTDRLGNRAI
jgi:dTDP-glucose 4,6-dehydratase